MHTTLNPRVELINRQGEVFGSDGLPLRFKSSDELEL
jgi:hypothetical protein